MPVAPFYTLCEEVVGQLCGKSWQDNWMGQSTRPIVNDSQGLPVKEALRKGRFAFIKVAWDSLSSIERNSFISAAGSLPQAMRLFLSANINLIVSLNTMVTTYTPSSPPPLFELSINTLTKTTFLVKASGVLTTVPTGYTLLILSTACGRQNQVFTDPNNYSPIAVFTAGTDLSAPVDIVSEWKNYFGEITIAKKICLKSVLIDNSNGSRSSASFKCATVLVPVIPYYQGINFRATATYVTDPPGSTYEIFTRVTFPRITPQGNVVGWEDSGHQPIQRGSLTPPVLAGMNYVQNIYTAQCYRFNLPAPGIYTIIIGAGDISAMNQYLRIYDDNTLLHTISALAIPIDYFCDAAGNIWPRSSWSASNVPVILTFSTSVLRVKIGMHSAIPGNSCISTIIVHN